MIELVEKTANILRGVCFDRRIPEETKAALRSLITEIDSVTMNAVCGKEDYERLKTLAKAVLDTRNTESESHKSLLVAQDNFSSHKKELAAHEKAMLAASKAEKELLVEIETPNGLS